MKIPHAVRTWGRRAALGACFLLLGVSLIYLVAVNIILRTGRLDHWVTGATKGLFLKVDSGWTLWPGRVHLRGVELHFEDYNLQFSVSLDSAVVDIALMELPGKVFHLTRVRAEGVHYLFRHRVKDARGIERRLALYPRIAGYADPPLFEGPRKPPLTDAEYNLWTIQLEDVDVGVAELWFLEYRFTGHGRATGGFRLQPQRDARTDLCSLTLDGAMQVGKQSVMQPLHVQLSAQLDRHDPRLVQGAMIFRKISFDLDLHAKLSDLSFTDLYQHTGQLHLRRGQGALALRAKLSHGAWQADTAFEYTTRAITLSKGRAGLSGALALRAKLLKDARRDPLHLTASSRVMTLWFAGKNQVKGSTRPSARGIHIELTTTTDLTQPITLTSLDAKLELDAPDLTWLNGPLGEPPLFGAGSAHASTTLQWSSGSPAQTHLELDTGNAVLALGTQHVRLSGSSDMRLVYDPRSRRGHAQRLTLTLPEVALAVDRVWQPLPEGIRIRAERLSWRGLPPRVVDARVNLATGSIKALTPLVLPASFVRGIALAIFKLGKTQAVLEVEKRPTMLQLRLIQAQSGSVQARGIWQKEADRPDPCGWFAVSTGLLSVGALINEGHTLVKPFVSGSWWRERPTGRLACGRSSP